MKLKSVYNILRNQGLHYVIFRSVYELKRKFGLLKRKYPSAPKQNKYLSLNEWKKLNVPFFFQNRAEVKVEKNPTEALKHNYDMIRSGHVKYFNKDWKKVEDWISNPDTEYQYDISQHWTEVEDLSKEAGDIKFVWERSRFSWLYTIIRYDHHYDSDNAEYVFSQIESWMDANPINMGPNYKCSQETSLRCLNWIYALYFYKDSDQLTEARWQRLVHYIYWQIKHVYENIDFSRICVRNNHAITECMIIYLGGVLFPTFSESKKWKNQGLKWLEKEIAYQVYKDGTYIQHSHNYQRVLVQLLTWTIVLSERNNIKLSSVTYDRASSVVAYMNRCCVGSEGQLPNYGNNDGALFFPLADQDYTDYRPQINALYSSITLDLLHSEKVLAEEALWMTGNLSKYDKTYIVPTIEEYVDFNIGGIHTIKSEDDSFTFFKCQEYKDRPAHADNMHLDIWVAGENYLRDSGTYKYNTEDVLINYFAGTAGHNSVMLDDQNQMTKGSRFIWFDWTKEVESKVFKSAENLSIYTRAKMFPKVNGGVTHERTVTKNRSTLNWKIEDIVSGKNAENMIRQLWHPNPQLESRIGMKAIDENGEVLPKKVIEGWWSPYYGKREKVSVWVYETQGKSITTSIEIST